MCRQDDFRESLRRLGAGTYARGVADEKFRAWIKTSSAYDVLDDAVMGCLTTDYVDELCVDFGITRREFSAAVDDALREGW